MRITYVLEFSTYVLLCAGDDVGEHCVHEKNARRYYCVHEKEYREGGEGEMEIWRDGEMTI